MARIADERSAGIGVRPLCSTVSEGLWHGVQPVTSAGIWMSDGVPGWPSDRAWQLPQFGPSPWSMPAWQLLQLTSVIGISPEDAGANEAEMVWFAPTLVKV